MKSALVLTILAMTMPTLLPAQQPPRIRGDLPEAGSIEAIARFTTEPRFLSPWVSYVPASSTVPSPTQYLGHVVGAPGELSSTAKIYGYFRALDQASPRVQASVMGRSEEGRDILLVAVADEDGIRDLNRLKAATAALADPRKTTADQAEEIIATARPLYYFNAGLHSTETGSPEMVMELAYRLAVSEDPMIQQIRRRLVVLINPVSEPDGRDKQVDWFYRYLKGKTDWEDLPPRSAPYWGYYVFHDNNRDTHQKALQLTRAVHSMFYEYHPTVVHDLHESIPLLHTWNGTGPYNLNLDPILINEWFETSMAEIGALTSMGMPGGETWVFGEGWGHHYLESVAVNHNSLGKGYETFGNSTAETVERRIRTLGKDYGGNPNASQQWYRPLPIKGKFQWSLRNNTNYMQTGCLAVLDYAAKNAPEMLRNFYRKGHNSWQKGIKEKPYAFVIGPDQGDRRRVAQMMAVLRGHGIEVGRARAAFTVDEDSFAAGSYVIRMDQPYRNYAVDLLAPQKFPAESSNLPYDDVSWALPVHYGIEAKAIGDTGIRDVALDPLNGEPALGGRVSGNGRFLLLKDTGQEALFAARHRLAAYSVEIAEQAFKVGNAEYPAGSWIIQAPSDAVRAAVQAVASELAIDFQAVNAAPDVRRHPAPLPRLAVWHPWYDTESIGWIRYTLDQQKIPYDYIRDEEIRAGGLKNRWDVLLYGNVSSSLREQIHGYDTRYGPLAYTKTAEFPSHGVPDASEDITGGIGWAGMANLQRFLEDGGLMITLGDGSVLPLEGGLVRGVNQSGGGVFTPGVELRATFTDSTHPIAYGYPPRPSAFRGTFTVYDLPKRDRSRVVMQWGTQQRKEDREDTTTAKSEDLLVSGGIKAGDDLEGRPAILDIPAPRGTGRVIAFNFNPLHRDLNHSDYRFLWNAVLNWRHILERGRR